MYKHSKWISQTILPNIHPEIIRKITYLPDNNSIISSSESLRNSLVIMDVERKKKSYIFRMNKVGI